MKLPNGSFLIPSPTNPSGLTILRDACNFNEDQGLGDVDYVMNDRSTFFARYFIADKSDGDVSDERNCEQYRHAWFSERAAGTNLIRVRQHVHVQLDGGE